MARRMSKKELKGWIFIIMIGLPIYGAIKFVEIVGIPAILIGATAIGVIILIFVITSEHERKKEILQLEKDILDKHQERNKYLLDKYQDEPLVEKLIGGYFWIGQSSEQLLDSMGNPEDIDEKVLKTKTKEIWKYGCLGRNRYSTKITIENGIVVEYENK